MSTCREIFDWQQRLHAAPRVWMVMLTCTEESGDLYDSQEGAEIGAAWHRTHGCPKARVVYRNMHTLELSRERWGGFAPTPPEGQGK